MKKFLFSLIAIVSIAVACNPEESKDAPAVSFETALPVVSDASASFKIAVNNYSGTTAVEIPVIFGGDAVKGVDYSVSAESFVYGGDNPVTEIVVTALKFGTGKKVSLSLDLPNGWVAGNYSESEFVLSDKLGYISFERKSQFMTDMVIATVNLYDANGNPKALVNGGEVEVAVVTDESTAVEGTDFKFSDKKVVVFAPGAKSGTVKLELIGDDVADGHDKIVLAIVTGEKYELGQYVKSEITIAGSEWNKFSGKWVLNEFVTDAAYIQGEMWFTDEDMVGFPVTAEDDAFTIDLANGVFKPEFTSDIKNFFIGESNIVKSEPYVLTAGFGDKRTLQMLQLDNTNRNFSATSQSEDKVSYVGARIIVDEETNEELLDLYLLDYMATDFLKMYVDYGMYNETKPMATATCTFLNLTFKKAK
jgi:hypothetical protein